MAPELLKYDSNADLPEQYAHQIVSFIRIHWFDAYQFDIHAPAGPEMWHPTYFVLADGPALFSAARALWQTVKHDGNTYKCYGLGAVFTYPAFRKRGYGRQVVDAATQHILASDGDLALLWTGPELEPFYGQSGWQHPDKVTVLLGDEDNPEVSDDFFMMLFLSETVKQRRATFDQTPIYFGPWSW